MDDQGRYDYRQLILELTGQRAHVHLYGQFRRLQPSTGWLLNSPEAEACYQALAASNEYFHIHPPISPGQFVDEWSCYDVGLLHAPDPHDRFRALNFPNRYGAYIAAGVPVAVVTGEMPSMQRHLSALNAAVIYEDVADLVRQLPENAAAAGAMAAREAVTFEAIFPDLIASIQACLP